MKTRPKKSEKIKVSFILGIYNAERTLRECLEGIFMQKYPEKRYEVIIIDGGSTDSTLEIAEEFKSRHNNIKILHNPKKLSEGKGMSKDMGVEASTGEIIIFLDHDNIILHDDWLEMMLFPFEEDEKIMATQSLLQFLEKDSLFLKYVNAIGVEDPFAVPYSIVSQAILNPSNFETVNGKYYAHYLNKKYVLFGGANGGAFRKKVFKIIEGYTRDVDVYAGMAEYSMKVAVVKNTRLYHATSNNFLSFLKKKGVYFYRFINREYKLKKFQWVPTDFRGKLNFYLMVAGNLSILYPFIVSLKQFIRTGRYFWFLHAGYLFFVTLEYGAITIFKIKNFISYGKKN